MSAVQALRLALHAAGLDELLPPDDYGDDLFDTGLLQVDPDNDAYNIITPAGMNIIRDALATTQEHAA
jgi:hypothetical protein